jgi:hypothetical protein
MCPRQDIYLGPWTSCPAVTNIPTKGIHYFSGGSGEMPCSTMSRTIAKALHSIIGCLVSDSTAVLF